MIWNQFCYAFSLSIILSLCGCSDSGSPTPASPPLPETQKSAAETRPDKEYNEFFAVWLKEHGPNITESARKQIGRTIQYDPAYVTLKYPGGDVPIDRGVCTDVVIRALRDAHNLDLQKLVHDDMASAFSRYPKIWGLKKPDRNIDHRRVPNLQCYFTRKGYSLKVSNNKDDYLPGDIVTCTVGRNLAHIMIVSDRKTSDGIPLIIHNIGNGTQEENALFSYNLTGHYRIK